ncbi:MAG: bifunctional tetrahydrofolate synthase/dihydrofolate synthase [Pseudomonadota bacterium]
MKFPGLAGWLDYLERLHPKTIELGLARVAEVRQRLQLHPDFPVITVGGTNGKGSTCAMLEIMLACAGYRVGCYTSPHLLRYNERVRIARTEAGDDELVAAFERVEAARGDISLTYFEFGTIAAMQMFVDARIDVAVLEVGLGGRLDVVNVFDADCAIVTSVALDHMDYLGDTREQIGFEKAGIFRAGRPAICADTDPPRSLLDHAQTIGADLQCLGRDFGYVTESNVQWRYWGRHGQGGALPWPALRGAYQLANASAAIAALGELRARLPVDMGAVRRGLVEVRLQGRFQVLPGRPAVVLDVAHNPHAAQALAQNLGGMGFYPDTHAVFAMLSDKDIGGVIRAVAPRIARWWVADIPAPRGATAMRLRDELLAAGVAADAIEICTDIADAYRRACHVAGENDRIAAFGSFYTVAAVMQARSAGT